MESFAVTDEKHSIFVRVLNVEDTSGRNFGSSHPQLSGKGFQYGEEDSKKNYVLKKYITSQNGKVIEILIPLFCLPAGWDVHSEANYDSLTGQSPRYEKR